MPAELDRCVDALRAKGMPDERAFPICKSRLELKEKLDDKDIEDMFNEFKTQEFKEMTFNDIPGVEIFATGTHNGDKFTAKDLDGIVNAFVKTKDFLKPFVKIGHNDRQNLLASDELPNAGLIDNLRRVGNKLVADFKRVPKKVFEVIQNGLFSKISSELFVNFKQGDQVFPLALKAVAILGGETPAVRNLKDIIDLGLAENSLVVNYGENKDLKEYEIDRAYFNTKEQEDSSMSTEELTRQNAKLEAEVKSYKEENASLEKDLETSQEEAKKFKEENETLKQENEKLLSEKQSVEEESIRKQNESFVDELTKEGKIFPSQKQFVMNILQNLSTDEDGKISLGEKKYSSKKEFLSDYFKAGEAEINLDPKSQNTGKQSGDDALIAKAQEYAEKHKVSLSEAMIQVSE